MTTIGNTDVEATTYNSTANYAIANRVQVPAGGITIATIYFYIVSGFTSSEHIRFGVYDDSSNVPTDLLAEADPIEGSGETGEWVSAVLQSPLGPLTEYTYVWLVAQFDAQVSLKLDNSFSSEPYFREAADTYSGGLNDPWSGGASIMRPVSFYGDSEVPSVANFKSIAGLLTSSGILSGNLNAKSLAGTLALAGEITKKTSINLIGTLALAGEVTTPVIGETRQSGIFIATL